jgi:excinuclease ABC subunit C
LTSPPRNALETKIALLPKAPGVYILKNKKGVIIYVGKAKSLRNRVQSYGKQHTASPPGKMHSMVSQISDLDHLVTTTEKEALILESTLIKRHRPRYNVILKDDKNYPYIKLTLEEQFPRLSLVRRVKKDSSLYFGPFTSAQAVRETLKVIHQHFLLRKCQSKTFQFRQRPCLNYQMGQCPAPCFKLIDEKHYHSVVREVELFLKGQNKKLITVLQETMEKESDKLNFETAAKIRDRITSLKKTLEQQKTVTLDFTDRDVIALHRDEQGVTLVILFIRNGQLIGSKDFTLVNAPLPNEEIISSLVNQFYAEGRLIPQEILIPCSLEDQGVIQDVLRDRKGGRVELITPRKGKKVQLIELARLNAESVFTAHQHKREDVAACAAELKELLHLKQTPVTIECYDISNWGGQLAVGSMVQFKDGEPVKNNYRRFRIKCSAGADDCGMLYEVLTRRLTRGEEIAPLPDLLVVDGGKGQLNAARKVVDELDLKLFDVIALAKGKRKGEAGARETHKTPEQIFIPNRKNPVILPFRSAALLLLERIRDESHRFALRYHKKLRHKENLHSSLEDIPGVGEKMRNRLLTHFGSVENVTKASVNELCQVPFVKQKTAEKIHRFFRAEKGNHEAHEEKPDARYMIKKS